MSEARPCGQERLRRAGVRREERVAKATALAPFEMHVSVSEQHWR